MDREIGGSHRNDREIKWFTETKEKGEGEREMYQS
jgi:hypothetical protein